MNGPKHNDSCKACRSARRVEIDRRLLGGESTRAVSTWLAGQGEQVSHVSLANHKLQHCNVTAEALARVEAARARVLPPEHPAAPAFEAGVQQVLDNDATLVEIATLAMRVARKLTADDAVPGEMAEVVLFTGCLREARSAVKDRHELLHGKKVNLEGHITGLGDLLALGFDDDPGTAPGGADAPPPVEE